MPRKTLTTTLAVLLLFGPASTALAHTPHKPKPCTFDVGLSPSERACLSNYLVAHASWKAEVARIKAALAHAAAVRAAAQAVIARSQAQTAIPHRTTGINWYSIADCESGDGPNAAGPPYHPHWNINGYFDGGLQFLPSTWRANGGTRFAPYAYQATAAQQIAIASTMALSNWPVCGKFG